jgi:cell division protein FtsL
MLDNEKKDENNQEYKRGSVGIITAKTVRGNLKLIGLSAVWLVVCFCLAAFVAESGTVYDMIVGMAAFAGLSIIFSVCKIISITAKSKVKFVADLDEKKVQRNEQREKEAKVKAVEDARRKLHDLVVMQGKLKNYCESGIISEAEMKSTSEKLTVDIAEAEAELNALEERVEEKPQHGIETRKVKVIPVKIGSDKQESKAKQSKEEPQANEKQSTAGHKKNKKPIITYSLAALCLALGVLCVWQATQLSEARSDISDLQSTITAGETKMKAQSGEIKMQNEIIDDLNDRIDKLYGEVNRLLGYRKYLTAADFERSYQESLDETREITRKYG